MLSFFRDIFSEKVSNDCSTGSGVVPNGPYKGWKLVRTSHLDDKRDSGRERDHNFDCDTFTDLMNGLTKKRPLGINSGKWSLAWKNQKGYQTAIVQINSDKKQVTFVTVMQLNKKKALDYRPKKGDKFLDLGNINTPD